MAIVNTTILFLLLFRFPGDLNTAVTSGDNAFRRIDYPQAITIYEDQLRNSPNEVGLLWRLARVYVCSGEVIENGSGEPYFIKAEEYARKCVQLDSSNVEGRTWLAATLGYLALHAGTTDQVRLTTEMHHEIEHVLLIDPKNDAAYSMLGSMYRALGNVSWVQRQLAALFVGNIPSGGFEEGEAALKQAIALAPDVMRHHYELGVLYLDWGKKESGRAALERAASLPIRVAIDRPRLEKIKALLTSLGESH
jgi:tetratricopeptide (TPR) repeat protein